MIDPGTDELLIETPRLQLVPARLEHFEALHDPTRLGALLNCTICDGWNPFPSALPDAHTGLKHNPGLFGWWTYLFILKEPRRLIGVGGFHGPPTPQGLVEIGYGIATAFRGQKLAKEAASALCRHALSHASVRSVEAHTVPNENASTAVLSAIGMQLLGPKFLDSEGTVWHWLLKRNSGY